MSDTAAAVSTTNATSVVHMVPFPVRLYRASVNNKLFTVGAILIVASILFSFVGPLIYRTDQVHTNFMLSGEPPSLAHLLGTTNAGYDVVGRLMDAGQSTILVGVVAALLASTLGTLWGAVSGYYGGWVDSVMMRVVDTVYAIPPIILLLVISSVVSTSNIVITIIIAGVSWLGPARLIRGETLSIRTRDYVYAAKGVGVSNIMIILKHIVPNTIGTMLVQTTLCVADSILLFAVICYLGLGPPPPATNWGQMLNNGLRAVYSGNWWLIYPAGIAIVLVVVGFNLVGDGVRDWLDSRLAR